MKSILKYLLLLILLNTAYSNVEFKENNDGIIEFDYKLEGQFFIGEELLARVYAFDTINPLPNAYEFALKFNGNYYTAKFKLPKDKVYFLMTITNNKIVDNNHSKFYSYLPDKSIKNANYIAAMTYLGGLPENINRRINYKLALKHLEVEIQNFPKNITALVAYYSLLFDMKKIDFENYSKKLTQILDFKYDENDENQIKAITRALKILNRKEEAGKIEAKFIEKNPQSSIAEENYLAMLSQIDNLKDFSEKTINYLKQYPNITNREKIFSALVSGYLQTGDYKTILNILDNLSNVPPIAYSQLSFAILNDEKFEKLDFDERIKLVVDLIKKAINLAEKEDAFNKPKHITKSEWQQKVKLLLAGLYEEYGQILMSIGENEIALEKFQKSFDLYKDKAPLSLYENTMNLCIDLNLPETAFEIGLLAYEYNFPNEAIRKMMEKLHNELNKSSSFEIFETKIKASTIETRFNNYRFQVLDEDFSPIEFIDLSNKIINLRNDSNSVKVLVFWSSWCDPCDVALSAIDSLATLFKDNNQVKLASVNIWETEKNRLELIQKYFAESKPNFEVLLDTKDEAPFNISISGLPFFCLIGKDGKIKFIEQGFNEESFIERFRDKIQYLLR